MAIIECPLDEFYNSHGKYNPVLGKYFYVYKYQLSLPCFVLFALRLVFLSNTLTIQICLYAVFINFMCIFMYKQYYII